MSTIKNIYKENIDFAALALQDTAFAKALKSNGQLDFSNPESVQQLTKALLKRDFGLRISLPPDRLCPPVPNRLNYLLWIQGLLDTTSDNYADTCDLEREVLGLDIGTGASCIYPMLGCAQRPKWRFIGTDIDEKSMEFARKNVLQNQLQNRIKLLQTQKSDTLLPLDKIGFENIDFSMCNPPFYESKADMLTSAAIKQRPPFTACTGSESEMVTVGGEVVFVSRMITESLALKDRVRWYTSMLGKFSSVSVLIEQLREHKVDNYAVTEFVPRGFATVPSEYHISIESNDVSTVGQHVNTILSQLPLKWMWRPAISTGIGFSDKAIWSRASRRLHVKQETEERMDEDEDDPAFGFKIYVEGAIETVVLNRVTVRWMKGHDSVIFESFCGMVKRKLDGHAGIDRPFN